MIRFFKDIITQITVKTNQNPIDTIKKFVAQLLLLASSERSE